MENVGKSRTQWWGACWVSGIFAGFGWAVASLMKFRRSVIDILAVATFTLGLLGALAGWVDRRRMPSAAS